MIFEHLGDVSMKLGRYRAAVDYYRQALQHKHNHPDQLRRKLAGP